MKLTKFEQSGFILENKSGEKLALDIALMTPIEKVKEGIADFMLISHIHPDHFSSEHINKLLPQKVYLGEECIEALGKSSVESVEVKAGKSFNIGEFKVTSFEVDHGPNVKVKPRQNFGFLIEADGEKLYFGGDIFYPSGMDVSELEVDYALLPVGDFYTFGPKEAVEFARSFGKIGAVVPMHSRMNEEMTAEFVMLAEKAGLATKVLAVVQ